MKDKSPFADLEYEESPLVVAGIMAGIFLLYAVSLLAIAVSAP
jgi:hypothetical protein